MPFQVLPVIGAFMVLTAYALIQSGIWLELDAGYLALNIIESLLLGIVAMRINGWGSSCWSLPGPGSGSSGWCGPSRHGKQRTQSYKSRRIARHRGEITSWQG